MDGYAVLIPAYNLFDEGIATYIPRDLQGTSGARCVIVVNDGSHQEYLPIFEELKKSSSVMWSAILKIKEKACFKSRDSIFD